MAGLFRGFSATAVGIPVSWCLYFPIYDQLKATALMHTSTIYASMASSAVTSTLVNIATNPIFIARLRIQSQHLDASSGNYGSVFFAMRRIFREEGFLALYTGLSASLLGIVHVMV
jgi:solute carrier family 25 folate transporter 32